jgi:hypothetical protein
MPRISVRLCIVEGCGQKHHGKGFCRTHYLRMQKHGTLELKRIVGDDVARFWSKVDKNGPLHPALLSRCWLWNAPCNEHGYGYLSIESRSVLAHRYSYQLHSGAIPSSMGVLHKCDNPPCVNPEHLFLGTQLDNGIDMIVKGRSTAGEKHASAKVTEAEVVEIRALYASGTFSQKALGKSFGLSQMSIGRIVNRKYWKHI